MNHYRVQLTNLEVWWEDVEARDEEQAKRIARARALSWSDGNGRSVNKDVETPRALQFWPED